MAMSNPCETNEDCPSECCSGYGWCVGPKSGITINYWLITKPKINYEPSPLQVGDVQDAYQPCHHQDHVPQMVIVLLLSKTEDVVPAGDGVLAIVSSDLVHICRPVLLSK